MSSKTQTMVYTGEFWTGSVCAGLCEGFQKAGIAVQAVDLKHFLGLPEQGFFGKLRNKIERRSRIEKWKSELHRQIKLIHPDYFFTIKRTVFSHDELESLTRGGIRTGIFYPDVSFSHPNVELEALKAFNVIATTKKFHLEFLKEHCPNSIIKYVPHGYTPSSHIKCFDNVTENQYYHDIFYAGNFSEHKATFLQSFLDLIRSADYDFAITGPSWKSKDYIFLRECFDQELYTGLSYARQIQLAKINLAIHCGPIIPDKKNWYDRISTRTFEIPACGGFMLHVDNDEIREFYTPGVDIDVFTTPEEAADKVHFYLKNEKLRDSMIASALNRTIPNYSYDERAKMIHELLGSYA